MGRNKTYKNPNKKKHNRNTNKNTNKKNSIKKNQTMNKKNKKTRRKTKKMTGGKDKSFTFKNFKNIDFINYEQLNKQNIDPKQHSIFVVLSSLNNQIKLKYIILNDAKQYKTNTFCVLNNNDLENFKFIPKPPNSKRLDKPSPKSYLVPYLRKNSPKPPTVNPPKPPPVESNFLKNITKLKIPKSKFEANKFEIPESNFEANKFVLPSKEKRSNMFSSSLRPNFNLPKNNNFGSASAAMIINNNTNKQGNPNNQGNNNKPTYETIYPNIHKYKMINQNNPHLNGLKQLQQQEQQKQQPGTTLLPAKL